MPDIYPGDPWARLRQLEKDVEELKALLRSRSPLTSASQGWQMANMSIPTPPAGTCHIGCSGGEFYAVNSAGTVKRLFSQAASIANQANFTSTDIGSAPNAAQYNALRADAVATRQFGFDLTTRLRNAGIVAI